MKVPQKVERGQAISTLFEAIKADPENVWAAQKGWDPVFTAHEEAKILIVGQAPGKRAQENGVPFDDRSGDNLRNWLGVTREAFYDPTIFALVPMDFYFPGSLARGDMPPRKGFAEKWHPLLLQHMPNIKLKILIGQYAHAYYLGMTKKGTLTETVRSYTEYLPEYLPLVHPSPRNIMWQKKNPWFFDEVVPVLRGTVGEILDR